jgi:hypothetical protein
MLSRPGALEVAFSQLLTGTNSQCVTNHTCARSQENLAIKVFNLDIVLYEQQKWYSNEQQLHCPSEASEA